MNPKIIVLKQSMDYLPLPVLPTHGMHVMVMSLCHLRISNFKNTVILYVICAPCNLIKVTLHAVNHHVLTARLHICSYEIPCGRRSRDRRAYDKILQNLDALFV